MSVEQAVVLSVLFFAAAVLYSSVGHAGASAYLAAMALVGLPSVVMKPTALSLNILVATITTIRFHRAGNFCWPTFWPFACASVPLAFVGGMLPPITQAYNPLVGVVLLVAAGRIAWTARAVHDKPIVRPPIPFALVGGGGIGLLSGFTGTGGGIFLTPLLLFMNWAGPRQAAGVSAAFILVNSIAGLTGNLAHVRALPAALPLWAIIVAAGALLGSRLGSARLAPHVLRYLLAVVLVVAAIKMLLTTVR